MTGLLIDTHVLLDWASAPSRISDEARIAIASGRTQLYFSHASIWEINIKIAKGKLRLPDSAMILMERSRCKPLPIGLNHLAALLDLPHLHGDPFDRILICQANAEKLQLVTSDRKILQYDVMTLAA